MPAFWPPPSVTWDQVGLGLPRGSRAVMTAFLLAHRQALALEPFPPAAPAQKERRPSEVLQRPDHRTGEEVRDSEIPLPTREEASGQDVAAQRETGQFSGSRSPSRLLVLKKTLAPWACSAPTQLQGWSSPQHQPRLPSSPGLSGFGTFCKLSFFSVGQNLVSESPS